MQISWLLKMPFTLSHQHDESVLTIFILDTGKQVPKQTVKTQMKCHKVAFHQGLLCLLIFKHSSGTEIHHFIDFLNTTS